MFPQAPRQRAGLLVREVPLTLSVPGPGHSPSRPFPGVSCEHLPKPVKNLGVGGLVCNIGLFSHCRQLESVAAGSLKVYKARGCLFPETSSYLLAPWIQII